MGLIINKGLIVISKFNSTYLQYFSTILRQISQLFQFDLVALALVQVGKRLFVILRCDRCSCCQYVLKPEQKFDVISTRPHFKFLKEMNAGGAL